MIASEKLAGDISIIQTLLEPGKDVGNYSFTLFDFLPCNIFLLEVSSGKLAYVNKQFAECLQVERENSDALSSIYNWLPGEADSFLLNEQLANFNIVAEGDQYAFEASLEVEGQTRTFFLKGNLVAKVAGVAEYILFVAEETTALHHTKKKIEEHKELAKNAEALLQFGCWTYDTSDKQMVLSDGIFALLGRPPEKHEKPASYFMEHVHLADQPTLSGCLRSAIEKSSTFDCTYRVFTAQGNERTFNTIGRVVESNKSGSILMGITHDVTEQALSHQALINYRQMMLEKELFLNHGSWEYDLDSRSMTASDGFLRLFGYDSAIERPALTLAFFQQHVVPEEVEKILGILRSVLRDQDNYVFEFSLTNKDGERKQIESYGKIIRGDDHRVKRIIGASRDVTRMRKYEQTLEQKIQQLNRSNADLEDFAYVASHDLQEPLRKIITFGQRIVEKYNEALTDEGVHYLHRMMNAAGNMRTLIESLLEFSRLRLNSEPSKLVSFEAIVDEVLNDLELKIEETNAVVQHQNLPTINGYPGQLKQLVMNLVNNAIKFTKPDENPRIKITGSTLTRKERERMHLSDNCTWYKLQFSDNGIGFEQDHAQKIFQLFQRLHSKAEYAGSGIGLSICKKIVENHGGQIFATSEAGNGSVFTVLLPAEFNNL